MSKPLILVIEDNKDIRMSACFVLEDLGFSVAEAEAPRQAKLWLANREAALVLLDMNFHRDTTSGSEGLEFLQWYREQNHDAPIVAMTAWSHTDLVVQAMQAGASDFLEKPWANQRLAQIVQQQLQLAVLSRKNQAMNQQLAAQLPEIVWHSEAMLKLQKQLMAVAETDASILLRGENGTGKSLLAHWLHLHSLRQNNAFVSVNMGAIPEQLFESEMFGHRKGAFTDAKEKRIGRFELADGGTLFLDEVGAIPLNQQAKLLRVLESKEFEMVGSSHTQSSDVRVIAASNGNFDELIESGAFRRDLYFRLNTFEFTLPPLRDRREDIDELANYYLIKHGSRYGKSDLRFSPSAQRTLRDYHWPGNIRELSHMLERAVLLSTTSEVNADVFNIQASEKIRSDELPMMTLDQAECQLMHQALAESEGNKLKAASLLGITKSSLYRRLEKHGISI